MERGSLITNEELSVLQKAQKTLGLIRVRAIGIENELPTVPAVEWGHEVGIQGACIEEVRSHLEDLTSRLLEVESDFEI